MKKQLVKTNSQNTGKMRVETEIHELVMENTSWNWNSRVACRIATWIWKQNTLTNQKNPYSLTHVACFILCFGDFRCKAKSTKIPEDKETWIMNEIIFPGLCRFGAKLADFSRFSLTFSKIYFSEGFQDPLQPCYGKYELFDNLKLLI